ncbi:MAG: hypothetical protein P4N59_25760 [Negativicutes bacterium]|nr:hypothetical protein [Negativicutes bacterium]
MKPFIRIAAEACGKGPDGCIAGLAVFVIAYLALQPAQNQFEQFSTQVAARFQASEDYAFTHPGEEGSWAEYYQRP